jgi:hypothetical protein
MNIAEALTTIESTEFDVNLNVVSSTSAFFKAAAKQPAVIEINRYLQESGEAPEDILGRIYDLARLTVDHRYSNPKDTPLAVLLWLTSANKPEYAALAAQYVDLAANCWYAKKLAHNVLEPAPLHSGSYWHNEPKISWESSGTSSDHQVLVLDPRPGLPQARFIGGVRLSTPSGDTGDIVWYSI